MAFKNLISTISSGLSSSTKNLDDIIGSATKKLDFDNLTNKNLLDIPSGLPTSTKNLTDIDNILATSAKKIDIDDLVNKNMFEPDRMLKNVAETDTITKNLLANIDNIDSTLKSSVKASADDTLSSTIKSTSDDLDNVAKSQKGIKQTLAEVNEKAIKFIKTNPKLIIGGLTVATLCSVALAQWQARDGKQMQITQITAGDKGHKIVYVPAIKITTNDTVTLSSTNSVPNIDGDKIEVVNITNNQIIQTASRNISLTQDGSTGMITLHTTFEAQLKDVIDGAASSITSAATTALNPVLDKVSSLWSQYSTVIIVILVIAVICSSLSVAFKFM